MPHQVMTNEVITDTHTEITHTEDPHDIESHLDKIAALRTRLHKARTASKKIESGIATTAARYRDAISAHDDIAIVECVVSSRKLTKAQLRLQARENGIIAELKRDLRACLDAITGIDAEDGG